MHMRKKYRPSLDRIITAIAEMDRAELDRVQEAVKHRRQEIAQSTVLERRPYRDGVLQLESRRNPKSGTLRIYWYYRFRSGGKQESLYVGKVDNPEAVVDEKLGKGVDDG
jgi:hypothetical protein